MIEFMIVISALTLIGIAIAWRLHPGPVAQIAQDSAAGKIAFDRP